MGTRGDFEIVVASQNSIAQSLFLGWVKRLETRLDRVYVRLISEKLSECIDLLRDAPPGLQNCLLSNRISSDAHSRLTAERLSAGKYESEKLKRV